MIKTQSSRFATNIHMMTRNSDIFYENVCSRPIYFCQRKKLYLLYFYLQWCTLFLCHLYFCRKWKWNGEPCNTNKQTNKQTSNCHLPLMERCLRHSIHFHLIHPRMSPEWENDPKMTTFGRNEIGLITVISSHSSHSEVIQNPEWLSNEEKHHFQVISEE